MARGNKTTGRGQGRGMRAVFVFLAGLWLAAIAIRLSADTGQGYTVAYVNDGDTVVLEGARRQPVRYLGIDTPEIDHRRGSAEPLAIEARDANRRLVLKRRVRLEFDREKSDRYGRWLAYVFLQDGTFVNQELLRRGLAFCLLKPPNDRYAAMFLEAQRAAMQAGRGLWKGWVESGGGYIGNRSSHLFHLPDCPNAQKMSARNRIRFNRRWEAFWAGYAPARGCLKGAGANR